MFKRFCESTVKLLNYFNEDGFDEFKNLLKEVVPSYAQKTTNLTALILGFGSTFALHACVVAQSVPTVLNAKDFVTGLSVGSVSNTLTSPSGLMSVVKAGIVIAAGVTLAHTAFNVARKASIEFGESFATATKGADTQAASPIKLDNNFDAGNNANTQAASSRSSSSAANDGDKKPSRFAWLKDYSKCEFMQYVTGKRVGSLNFNTAVDLLRPLTNVAVASLAMSAIGQALKGDVAKAACLTFGTVGTQYMGQQFFNYMSDLER